MVGWRQMWSVGADDRLQRMWSVGTFGRLELLDAWSLRRLESEDAWRKCGRLEEMWSVGGKCGRLEKACTWRLWSVGVTPSDHCLQASEISKRLPAPSILDPWRQVGKVPEK